MPLAGELYAAEPGPLRTDDARKQREFESFKANYDQRLGRELTPAEVVARNQRRAVTESWAAMHAADKARDAQSEADRVARQKASEDRERQRVTSQQLAAKRREAQQQQANIDFQIDAVLEGATPDERGRIAQAVADAGRSLNDPEAFRFALMEIRAAQA
jgi:hypothetical protein